MPLVLITRLAALAEAVAELRHAQQHAAQAAAARTAAERLHAATGPAPAHSSQRTAVPAAPPGSPMNPSPSPSGPSPANPNPASPAPDMAPGQDAGPRRHGHAAPAANPSATTPIDPVEAEESPRAAGRGLRNSAWTGRRAGVLADPAADLLGDLDLAVSTVRRDTDGERHVDNGTATTL